MKKVYISLGSNLKNPLNQLHTAINFLAKIPKSSLICTSSFYRTSPYGRKNQPDYFNAVVLLKTLLNPEKLFQHMQKIEKMQGRKKTKIIWGPRIIDLDILLFGRLTLNTNSLTIPHYDLKNRFFILLPLLEINPKIRFPDGKKVLDLI